LGQVEEERFYVFIIPSAAFKSDEPVMLDGMTHDDLERELKLPLRVVDFAGFGKMLLES